MTPLRTLAMTLLLCSAGAAFAQSGKLGAIIIDHPWSRATVPVVPTGVAYFVLRNTGQSADRLLSVSTPVAGKAELHAHVQDGDMVRMQRVAAVDLAPASTTALEPGGLHVMLMQLKQPLVKGKAFPLTLTFEHAGAVTVDVDVQGITDMAPAHTGGDHDGRAHHGQHGHRNERAHRHAPHNGHGH